MYDVFPRGGRVTLAQGSSLGVAQGGGPGCLGRRVREARFGMGCEGTTCSTQQDGFLSQARGSYCSLLSGRTTGPYQPWPLEGAVTIQSWGADNFILNPTPNLLPPPPPPLFPAFSSSHSLIQQTSINHMLYCRCVLGTWVNQWTTLTKLLPGIYRNLFALWYLYPFVFLSTGLLSCFGPHSSHVKNTVTAYPLRPSCSPGCPILPSFTCDHLVFSYKSPLPLQD